MLDSYSLAAYSTQLLQGPGDTDLDQRLGLYRVFLKLYEHHRALLDEILDLENVRNKSCLRSVMPYVQGNVQASNVHLVTNLLGGDTQSIDQPQGVWLIGRDRHATLPIRDNCLSRQHAAIQYVENQGFFLIDLDSTNGSFVNGEAVRQCVQLQDGDQVRLGTLTFTFFICHIAQTAAPISSSLLNQINTLRQSGFPLTQQGAQDNRENASSAEAPSSDPKTTLQFLRSHSLSQN